MSMLPQHNQTAFKGDTATRVTIRLTPREREALEKLSANMTLSAYIRACIFQEEDKRRKRRSTSVIGDKKAIAQILALLGQSRIANNLNQLAHHANLGTLEIDDVSKARIDEAYGHVCFMREHLIKALRTGQ